MTVEVDDKKERLEKKDVTGRLLATPVLEVAEEYAPDNVTIEVLEIKAIYLSGTKWEFNDGHGDLWARIDDETFWLKWRNHEYEVGDGDRFRVRLLTRQQLKPKLKKEYIILEVIEPLKGIHQEKLDGI